MASLFPNVGPVTVAEAHVKIVLDPATQKITLHTDEKLGPFPGPSINLELDPLHAVELAAHGIGGVLGNVFNGKK